MKEILINFGCFYFGCLIGIGLMCLFQINRKDPDRLPPDASGPVHAALHRKIAE